MKLYNKIYTHVTKLGADTSEHFEDLYVEKTSRKYAFEISSRYWLLDVPEPTKIYEQELLQLIAQRKQLVKGS